jgi:hypothetical protein
LSTLRNKTQVACLPIIRHFCLSTFSDFSFTNGAGRFNSTIKITKNKYLSVTQHYLMVDDSQHQTATINYDACDLHE